MIEGKGLGGKRVSRYNLSLTNQESLNLERLARSVNKNPSVLIREIFFQCIYNDQFLQKYLDEHCIEKAYRVVMLKTEGEAKFILTGRDDL
jgi:hypothetical protein